MVATRSQDKAGDVPKTTHFEFGGVPGSFLMPLGLPFGVYFLFFHCNSSKGEGSCDLLDFSFGHINPADFLNLEAVQIFLGWFAFQALLHIALPGPTKYGLPLRDGSRLPYKCNGLAAFWISMIVVGSLHLGGIFDLGRLHDLYLPLMTTAILFSFALSAFLYAKSFVPGAMLAEGGNSGYPTYDFFIGRELNPRIGNFDLKFFCELRPGLIGWVVLNFGLMAKQASEPEGLSAALILVSAFQFWYVLDALASEPAILSTMDICMDGFGFMLAFGDLAWVPFTYTLQGRYLVEFRNELSTLAICAIVACQLAGYTIFRGANGQKDQFKRDPNHPSVAHLKTIPTPTGSKLIASGWWGVARHINYFGDLLMALAWCLPCGFNNILPYFYVIYFTVLLIHRDSRDDHKCRSKYGKAWEKYCEAVPYRIFPYIY